LRTRVLGALFQGPSLARTFARFSLSSSFSVVSFSCVCCALLCGVAPAALATPFDARSDDWEGLSQLVRVAQSELGTARVAVTTTLALGDLKREDGILMVHPDRALDVDELSTFMRAGGRLVLLDDYGTGDELLTRFGIRRVPLPVRPAEMLRDNPALAIAEPASVHPTVRDVAHVVTNHGTGLEHQALSPLLVVHGEGEADVLLAVAGAVGHGRLVAIGDGSILINAMMRYPGNRALSRALVRYATEDDVWGKRGGTLYVLSSGFRTTGGFGDSSRANTAAGEARRALALGLETLRRDGLPPAAAYFAALAVGIGVVVWASARVGRTHRAVSPKFVRAIPVTLQGGVAGHAAVLASTHASRTLAILELKSALEEQLATRLGLDHVPPREELVGKVRSEGLVDPRQLRALSELLADLGRIETLFAQDAAVGRPVARRLGGGAIGTARVVAVAAQIRALLDVLENPHDRVAHSP
jgi:uncharacterized protein DUF4350